MDSTIAIATLRALRRVLRASDLGGRRLASATGLTPSQLLVLQEVERRGEATPTVIAQTLHFGQATVTNIVDRLVASGLLIRRRGESDKRTMLLTVTDAGRAKIAAAPDGLQGRFIDGFAKIAPWEQAMILAALERLGDLMGEGVDEPAPLIDIGPIDRPGPIIT